MLSQKTLNIIILAAGQGKRMRSAIPKVLHKLGGTTLLERVIATAQRLQPRNIYIVYGHSGELIRSCCAHLPVTWVHQSEQLGTAHAVKQVLPELIDPAQQVLILYGDVPLIQLKTLENLLEKTAPAQLGLLTTILDNPAGFGRIMRNQHSQVFAIIEDKDATAAQRQIKEINTGIMLASAKNLQMLLPKLSNQNAQAEYYLTDIISLAANDDIPIIDLCVNVPEEALGINDRIQLAQLERYYQLLQARELMLNGVTLLDPARFDLRGTATISNDVIIDINVILEGHVSIGTNSRIGPNCLLRNVKLGHNVEIKANSVIEDSEIGDTCSVGPFARIRPGTKLEPQVSVGNFVEIKNSQIGSRSKIPHLSYVGDAIFGEKVNFGAGAITCNYDGVNKSKTIIGNNVFIGSDSQLIAPIIVEDGAFIGAGSTISKNAPANKLTLSRSKQQTIASWQRPKKKQE